MVPQNETPQLPDQVVGLLKNSRYLHLGTSSGDIPHVSLMNYTYVAEGQGQPFEYGACVVLTSPQDTQKFHNISVNPNVSLLVHDWTTAKSLASEGSNLSQILQAMNHSQISSFSATLSGVASIAEGDAAKFFKEKHLQSNPSDARCFIDRDDVAVVVVKIKSAKVADVENHIQE